MVRRRQSKCSKCLSMQSFFQWTCTTFKISFWNSYTDRSPVALWSFPASRNLHQDSHLTSVYAKHFHTQKNTGRPSFAFLLPEEIHTIPVYTFTHRQGGWLTAEVDARLLPRLHMNTSCLVLRSYDWSASQFTCYCNLPRLWCSSQLWAIELP